MKEDSIFIVDDEGNEVEMKIYFTFDANDKQYVLVYEIDNEDVLYPFVYDMEGNIYPVEDEEELEMIEEVRLAYEEEN
ncbi:MAG: DUF1292 domain-containing protein [Erysipelotrichaceae bacterium]|nr:DUF1292 domain-containing protein [Erysipelotrichaceae bacterium]